MDRNGAKYVERKIALKKELDNFYANCPTKPKTMEEYFQKFSDSLDYIFRGVDKVLLEDDDIFITIDEVKKIAMAHLKKLIKEKK